MLLHSLTGCVGAFFLILKFTLNIIFQPILLRHIYMLPFAFEHILRQQIQSRKLKQNLPVIPLDKYKNSVIIYFSTQSSRVLSRLRPA